MKTLLIKGVSEDLLKELKRLKVELNCRTWAELLEKLVKIGRVGAVIIDEERQREVREGIDELIKLRDVVSSRWKGPSVLEESRRSRRHDD
ncbi:MAG: hypothetical protein B6U94_05720 [Thermofilum sp. ex4484_79]|nr:MAG: hypothetical protein B6U94_05720 [Thermofilum sp. ex4484_79]